MRASNGAQGLVLLRRTKGCRRNTRGGKRIRPTSGRVIKTMRINLLTMIGRLVMKAMTLGIIPGWSGTKRVGSLVLGRSRGEMWNKHRRLHAMVYIGRQRRGPMRRERSRACLERRSRSRETRSAMEVCRSLSWRRSSKGSEGRTRRRRMEEVIFMGWN
jgi:hypothetical protein